MRATMELSARAATAPNAKATRGHVLLRSTVAGAGVVAAGALVALVAWGFEATGLSAAPSWLTMKANTAGALFTASVSLLLLVLGEQRSSPRLRVAGQAAAGATLAIVFVSLLAFGIGNEFNFDEFLLQDDPDGTRSLAPARMAPAVWSGLTLLGVALLQLSRGTAMPWADAAAVALPIAFGWLSVLCVLYRVPAFEDFPGHSQLAVHTSLSFVFLGAAVLAARGRTGVIGVVVSRSTAGTVVRQLLPAVFLVPAVLGWIRLQGQSIGLYETEFGVAMFVLGFTACFTALVAHSARSVWSAEAARRETAAALRHTESKYALLFAEAPVAMYRTSPDGVLLDANKALIKLLGSSDPSMIIGSNVRRWYVDPGDRATFKATIERDGVANGQVIQLCRDDGTTVWVMDTSRRVTDPRTGDVSFEGGLVDVTERRTATEHVRASERRFRALIEHSADGLALVSRDGTVLYQSPAAQRILGRAPEARVGRNVGEFVHADDRDKVTAAFREVVQEPGAPRRVEVRYLHGDDTWHYLDSTLANYLEDPDIGAIVVNYRDVTERMRTASALRESDDRFREMAEHISDAFFVVDLSTFTPIYVSPNWSQIWGRPTAEGYDPRIWFDAIHPDDRAAMLASQEAVTRGERSESEFRVVRPDGTIRWVRGRAFPVRNREGVIYRMVGVSTDVTELRQAQDRFTQAQKMEAVGRLAGGVAHDFNNLLTVILADTEMVQSTLRAGSEESEYLAEVRRASESAVGLTRQLLAFSRKQLVEPVVFNLTDAVDDVTKMLRRLIGEDVRLETRLTSDSTAVRADRGQIEQVLTNLAVNARDAMANGGTLTIETAVTRLDEGSTALHPDVAPGEYIALIVSDTGSGMSEETRAHAFEPFFTTKGVGKGTGLGLATCHGIVKQAGGHITVYSEPGVGTTFRVLLPRVQPADTRAAAAVQAPHPRGVETVLLVEDESGVRRVGARLLRSQGYQVLEARDAAEALQVLAAHAGNVDLLFTDVVLPGMGGRQLADQVRAMRPAIKVLYTSGYTDDVILQHQLIAHDVRLLQKPYSLSSLSTKVRAALDAA